MTADEERIDKALDSLSLARTALDDPMGLPDGAAEVDGLHPVVGHPLLREFAIDKIDDAMRLLNIEKPEPKFALIVAQDGTFVSRHFDAEEETIDAVGVAINHKENSPDSVVTIIVGRVEP